MPRYYLPLDPACPDVAAFTASLLDDPMTHAMGAPVDDIMDGFTKRHRAICQRCQEYGAANVEIR